MYSLFFSLQSSSNLPDFCELCWLCVGAWLLLPLLGALLFGWYFWRKKYKGLAEEWEMKANKAYKLNAQLEEDLAACKKRRAELDSELARSNGQVRELKIRLEEEARANMKKAKSATSASVSGIAATKKNTAKPAAKASQNNKKDESAISAESLAEAKAVMGKRIKANDLKIVEGIGPKIEGLFKAAGIKTWANLADSKAAQLKKILNEAGPRYQMHNPGTWPRQAGYAVKGQWEKLLKYQEDLDGGKS